jgi:hypothetical protein
MPIEPTTPAFPRHESLARFFRMPPDARVPLAEVAALLGTSLPALRAMLRADGARPADGSLAWTEAAAYLFDAWPRALILAALGAEGAGVFPPEFLLTEVRWSVPIFIVRAIEHQAADAWRNDPRVRRSLAANHTHARGIDDYVADLLYNDITPATLAAFRHDRAFLRAFHYPILD